MDSAIQRLKIGLYIAQALEKKYHTNRFDGSLHQDLKAMNEGPPSPNLLCWRFAGVANTTAGPSNPSILFIIEDGVSTCLLIMTLENMGQKLVDCRDGKCNTFQMDSNLSSLPYFLKGAKGANAVLEKGY